ncbi:hypothetical protein FSP39_011122 [Pinctada imbricata]|uniref:Ammonium transporter n=1 Tax=Pinctada imbricata TaxID=66713 RepID=A0AA88YQS0_PINIB|nr:hypothetical protein FSP39_011122 [Pinctada imbricata]
MSVQNLSQEGLYNLTVDLQEQIQGLETWKTYTNDNMDQSFLLTMGIIIYLMQGGFALLEAGSVRSKNTTNILIKNLLDSFVSGIFYWLIGYAFAYGSGNSFIGYDNFAHDGLKNTDYATWFFQYCFAATAATIVSGAVAERCEFVAYLVYSSMITGFIYPVVSHWAWSSDGWLGKGFEHTSGTTITYRDFAGSGAVHTLSGVAAFVGAAVMGPRIGRFDKETKRPEDIKGHSVPLAALGGFILIFGFLAFNGASQGSISGENDGAIVSIAIKNTVMAGSGGAFTTMFMNRLKLFGDAKWSFGITLNGCLSGMVSICSSCNEVETYSALATGIIGGVAYMIVTWLMLNKLHVDDPLDACAVHFGGGVWGVIALAFFSNEVGIFYHWNADSGLQLAWQLVGLLTIIVWTAVLSFIMFYILKKFDLLRVPFILEMKGLDIPKHGEPAYPTEAYGHGWGERGDALHTMVKQSVQSSSTTLVSADLSTPRIQRSKLALDSHKDIPRHKAEQPKFYLDVNKEHIDNAEKNGVVLRQDLPGQRSNENTKF